MALFNKAFFGNKKPPAGPAARANANWEELRRWMYRNNVTFVALGQACGGMSAPAAHGMLKNDRMPVRHHAAICAACPGLPREYLPRPLDVPNGPRPKGLELELEGVNA